MPYEVHYSSINLGKCRKFKKCTKLGIKEKLDEKDLLDLLFEIKDKYNGTSLSEESQQWKKDSEVICNLCDSFEEAFLAENITRIFLPTQNKLGKLQFFPASECYFDDTYSESQRELLQKLEDDKPAVILQKMTNALAQKLKLKHKTALILGIVEFGASEGFEQWGQHQDLTSRIKEILQEYPEGSGIFKEQVQNSEDAEATKVMFFLDEQENLEHTETLLGEKMKLCNGRSLWVYNDAEFTENDFNNIIKIGGATKRKNLDKIGSFGI